MIKNCLLIFVVIALFSSCSVERSHRYIYASQPANIPFFQQKGDSKITGYYSSGTQVGSGFNVQGAYALSNHFAITAGYSTAKEN